MILAFLIPFSMGWDQASTAGITIMLIASSSGLDDSISKGLLRVIGTIAGAIIGLVLIAIYPQERVLYLLTLSLILGTIIYLYYSYRGDSSVFMLSGMVIMMIFINGPQNAFLYGVDRTFMTIFGIVIYSLVGFLLWPKLSLSTDTNKQNRSAVLKNINFIFLDPDNFKATLQLLSIFWITTLFWILFNPPGGFLLVTLATLLGLFTTFTPLKPSVLIALFSFSFLYAISMYVLILPNLVYPWELAIFIFIYTFIAYCFLPQKISIFFMIGLFLLNINNSMEYNFALFLNILLIFYMFLIILMLFQNIPFSTKPEYLFIKTKQRFLKHFEAYLNAKNTKKQKFHLVHLHILLEKMELWGSKIDLKYFNITSKSEIEDFIQNSKQLVANIDKPLNEEEKKSILLEHDKLFDNSSLQINRF